MSRRSMLRRSMSMPQRASAGCTRADVSRALSCSSSVKVRPPRGRTSNMQQTWTVTTRFRSERL
eukprot:5724793-Prymnesium_polylepis.1